MLYICNIKPPGHGQDGSGDTNKSAPRPVQGRREIRRGGPYKPSRGAPAKAPRRGGPLASPRTSRYTARARPEHGRFPGQAALRKPPGTHRRTRPAPKMPPEHHPHAPFGKGRQKSRQKEYIDIVGKSYINTSRYRSTAKTACHISGQTTAPTSQKCGNYSSYKALQGQSWPT